MLPHQSTIGGIYKITHIASGRMYVGSAIIISKRWHQHQWDLRRRIHSNQKLQRAWDKYGPDAFSFSVIEYVADPSNLIQREQHWINKLNAANGVNFNIHKVAGSRLGMVHSTAARAKIAAAGRGRTRTIESIEKTAAAHRGKPLSLDHRMKLSAAKIGRKLSAEHIANMSAGLMGRVSHWFGKKLSAEHCAKMSASRRRFIERNPTVNLRQITCS